MAPEIETERLRLRPLTEADADAMGAIYSEPAVREHLITRPQNREEFTSIFGGMLHYSGAGTLWGVAEKPTGRLIGRCGFYEFSEARIPELAFLLSQSAWGRGLATEAGGAAMRFGFGTRGWPQVVAVVRPANGPARRVLHKLGFAPTETLDLKGAPAELHRRRQDA